MSVVRATDGIEKEAIVRACQAFTEGLVEGQSLDFPPAIPRFVKECRNMEAAMRHARRSLPHPEPKDEQPRKRVSPEAMQALTDALAGKRTIESVQEEFCRKASAE